MNPSTALARVLVDELARGGVRDVVVAPGSRSAPLALAFGAQDRIRVHVRIDERSAGFLALGLALRGTPAAVVCTSGTAVANLHPAVLEAAHAGVPLVVLTADRPPELRATGANQTVDQVGLYGAAVRFAVDLGVPEPRSGAVRYWRSVVARALAAATDGRDPGPVHLNLALREPLVPDGDEEWIEPLGLGGTDPATRVVADPAHPRTLAEVLGRPVPERGAVVVGHGAVDPAAAVALADACGWPVLSEPTGNARYGPNAVPSYPLLLADPGFAAAARPDLVVVVGKPGLSRSLLGWLATADEVVVVDPSPRWADPVRRAAVVLPAVPVADVRPPTGWLASWAAGEDATGQAVRTALDGEGWSEPRLVRDLVAALPAGAVLLAGSSRPIRDVEAYAAARGDVTVLGNRGVSGIDGLVSTALGAALGHDGPAYALLGDLAFLHDHNGLVLGPGEVRPDLTLVVVDNDGGGIFSTLPPATQPGFERLFGTSHGLDLVAVAAAAGWPAQVLASPADLAPVLANRGPRVLFVKTERAATADLHRAVQRAVGAALRAAGL